MLKKLVLLFALIITHLSFANPVPKPTQTTSETSIIHSKVHYIDKKAYYIIDISVPAISISKDTKLFDKTIQTKVNQIIEQFKKGLTSPEELKKLHDSNPGAPTLDEKSNTLDIRYDLVNRLNNLVSVRFKVMSFYYMQAHPNNTVFTINYDFARNKLLVLSDLFKENSNYLQIIAAYCKAQLEKSSIMQYTDPTWLAKGTAPNVKNYNIWNLTPKGLLVTFDTYQVAAYAVGQPEILIPYSELKNVWLK